MGCKLLGDQLATFGRESGVNSCLVIESKSDIRWGYGGFTQQFLGAVSAAAEPDLFSAVKAVSYGENLLGVILTEFFHGIRDMNYPAYMEAVSGIEFVRVVE